MNLHQQFTIDSSGTEVRIGFVGDLHLNTATPKSRIDNYPETLVEKLESLRILCLNNDIKYLVFLGDIFHKPAQPVSFIYQVLQKFLDFKNSGIQCYAISGNHDISFESLDTLSKSALGILFEVNALVPFSDIYVKGTRTPVHIKGFHYTEEPTEPDDFTYYNIMVAHMFYEFDLSKESLNKEDLARLKYNMVVLGHDHTPYDLLTEDTISGKVRVVRPGSFSRGTSHSYNINRSIFIDVLNINGQINIKRFVVPSKPSDQIFSSTVLDNTDLKELNKELSEQFIDLVNRIYSQDTSSFDVYQALDSSTASQEVKDRIVMYLEQSGIFRKDLTK